MTNIQGVPAFFILVFFGDMYSDMSSDM